MAADTMTALDILACDHDWQDQAVVGWPNWRHCPVCDSWQYAMPASGRITGIVPNVSLLGPPAIPIIEWGDAPP